MPSIIHVSWFWSVLTEEIACHVLRTEKGAHNHVDKFKGLIYGTFMGPPLNEETSSPTSGLCLVLSWWFEPMWSTMSFVRCIQGNFGHPNQDEKPSYPILCLKFHLITELNADPVGIGGILTSLFPARDPYHMNSRTVFALKIMIFRISFGLKRLGSEKCTKSPVLISPWDEVLKLGVADIILDQKVRNCGP